MTRMRMLQKGWENLNPVVLAAVRSGADSSSIGVRIKSCRSRVKEENRFSAL